MEEISSLSQCLFPVGYIAFSNTVLIPHCSRSPASVTLHLAASKEPHLRGESISKARLTLCWVWHASPVGLSPAHHSHGGWAQLKVSSEMRLEVGWSLSLSCGFKMSPPPTPQSITQWRDHCHCQICSWIEAYGNCELAMRVWLLSPCWGCLWMCFWLSYAPLIFSFTRFECPITTFVLCISKDITRLLFIFCIVQLVSLPHPNSFLSFLYHWGIKLMVPSPPSCLETPFSILKDILLVLFLDDCYTVIYFVCLYTRGGCMYTGWCTVWWPENNFRTIFSSHRIDSRDRTQVVRPGDSLTAEPSCWASSCFLLHFDHIILFFEVLPDLLPFSTFSPSNFKIFFKNK